MTTPAPAFRPMRRRRQQLPEEQSIEILRHATSGVLSVLGDDGYPYGVPLSYVYHDGRLIFHSAVTGHKVDAIRACNKASFCVVELDDVQAERFTTFFRSVIAFGRIRVLETDEEKMAAIRILAHKYSPHAGTEATSHEIARGFPHLLMFELAIEHVTGKQAKELMP